MSFVTLEEARKALEDKFGPGVKIALEPVVKGKEDQLWRFDPATGITGRDDKKLYEIEVVFREDKGFWQPRLKEEPGAEDPIVGHVGVEIFEDMVVVRENSGFNGSILELRPSSLSKGEKLAPGSKCTTNIEANPQRIEGMIKCCVKVLDEKPELAPGECLMPIKEFLAQTTDGGRSMAALVKALIELNRISIL
jgi:hypothetical protein